MYVDPSGLAANLPDSSGFYGQFMPPVNQLNRGYRMLVSKAMIAANAVYRRAQDIKAQDQRRLARIKLDESIAARMRAISWDPRNPPDAIAQYRFLGKTFKAGDNARIELSAHSSDGVNVRFSFEITFAGGGVVATSGLQFDGIRMSKGEIRYAEQYPDAYKMFGYEPGVGPPTASVGGDAYLPSYNNTDLPENSTLPGNNNAVGVGPALGSSKSELPVSPSATITKGFGAHSISGSLLLDKNGVPYIRIVTGIGVAMGGTAKWSGFVSSSTTVDEGLGVQADLYLGAVGAHYNEDLSTGLGDWGVSAGYVPPVGMWQATVGLSITFRASRLYDWLWR